jgi:hypothetical protein
VLARLEDLYENLSDEEQLVVRTPRWLAICMEAEEWRAWPRADFRQA